MRETGEDMNWWQMETKEAARRLETDEKQGLTSQMAAERLAQKGRNELAETDGKKSLFWRFLAQFDDFMILLLLGAAVVSVVISGKQSRKGAGSPEKNGGASCSCHSRWCGA